MLFNEPKLLKLPSEGGEWLRVEVRFSALQRAEIAEIDQRPLASRRPVSFSALQRAEIAEIAPDEPSRALVQAQFQCSSTSRNC